MFYMYFFFEIAFCLQNGTIIFYLRCPLTRASDIWRGRGPAKFRYFREIPRNPPEICPNTLLLKEQMIIPVKKP